FQDWLGRLSERRRRSAELRSQGFGTVEVARQVGLTPAAITQARAALARNWSMTTIPSRLIMRSITFLSMAKPRLALPDPGARGVTAIRRIRRRSSMGRRPATTRAPAWQP